MSGNAVVSIHVKLAPSEYYWASVRSTTQQMRKVLVLFGFVGFLSLAGLIFATLFSISIKEWQQTIRGTNLPLFAFVSILPIMVILLASLFSLVNFLANPGNKAGARIRFSESGILTESAVGKTDWGWTIYLKLKKHSTISCCIPATLTLRLFQSVAYPRPAKLHFYAICFAGISQETISSLLKVHGPHLQLDVMIRNSKNPP